jgi:hypothetical protein
MKMITTEMYETAIHEAAHAVVASALKGARRVDRVTIQPNEMEGYLGEVTYLDSPPAAEPTWEFGLAEAIHAAAGEIAGARVSGRRVPFGENDLMNIVVGGTYARLSAPPRTLDAGRALRLAEVLVNLAWPEIQQVAEELLERTTVYGDTVRQLVARRWPTGLSVADIDAATWAADREALEFVTRTLRSVAKLPQKRSA